MNQKPHPGCYHDPVSLDFHYTIEGLGHQVIVTDTRTWRTTTNMGEVALRIFFRQISFNHRFCRLEPPFAQRS